MRNTVRSGRRAQLVTLAHRTGIALGVHIGLRHLRVAVADTRHEVLAEQTLPLPFEHRVDTTLDRAARLLPELLDRVGADDDEILGVGMGIPAPVDTSTGVISVPGILRGWDDVEIGHVMTKRLGRPVFVDNDANQGALAESRLGASRPFQDSVYVRASFGTGAGVMIAGRLHKDTRELVAQTIATIKALQAGEDPDVNDTESYDNDVKIVPAYLLTPIIVTQENAAEVYANDELLFPLTQE